jgi:FtsP/CotA-like multicopper oxidase with cupredoxin domain
MRKLFAYSFVMLQMCLAGAWAQSCPTRPAPGSTVADPTAIYSQSGVLTTGLTIENYLSGGFFFYCYAYQTGVEAPTLRLNPSDSLNLSLTNQIQQFNSHPPAGINAAEVSMAKMDMVKMNAAKPRGLSNTDCNGTMTSVSTNLHFHGLNIPPLCHQDETLYTLINPGDPAFLYQFAIPANEPPGLYWYHPHPHGMTEGQVLGGASGAIIIEGIEKIKPEVAGLTEHILVLRDQPSGPMTINYVPTSPGAPVINTAPSEKQFWRVLNAEGEVFVNLQIKINGQPQTIQVISIDGVPLKTDYKTTSVQLPPAGRVEFIMQGPPTGGTGTFSTLGVNTGIKGTKNPAQLIANIMPAGNPVQVVKVPAAPAEKVQRFSSLVSVTPIRQRSLFFSEYLGQDGDSQFYITVAGQKPKFFQPSDPPEIITQQGAVEDWTIENQAEEIHAFHIHQLHFMVMAVNGVPVKAPYMADTISIPGWSGKGAYPSVTLRMDFRYPESVGTFLYHCHILYHEDDGMMAKIQVNPSN